MFCICLILEIRAIGKTIFSELLKLVLSIEYNEVNCWLCTNFIFCSRDFNTILPHYDIISDTIDAYSSPDSWHLLDILITSLY